MLLRRVLQPRVVFTPRRFASTEHQEHHHEQPQDQYPPETFGTPFWRNVLIISVVGFAAYRFMPADPFGYGEDFASSVHRYLRHHLHTPAQIYEERNIKHLELSLNAAKDKIVLEDAERPKIRRLRGPGMFDNASPFNVPIGTQVDLSDLVIKKSGE